jgi:hypothetical protein
MLITSKENFKKIIHPKCNEKVLARVNPKLIEMNAFRIIKFYICKPKNNKYESKH